MSVRHCGENNEGTSPEVIGRVVSKEIMKYFETEMKPRTIARRVRRKNVTDVTSRKPLKKKTKPEVKCQLDTVVSSILAGSVSNDTLKARISGLYNLAHIHAWAFLSSNATG